MKFILCAVALMLGFPLFADTLATVSSSKISTDDFNKKLDEIRKQAMNPPSPDQFLEDMIRFEVGVQEAEKMKLQNDPSVRERMRQVLYNALLEKQLGKKIDDIKITESEMREYYKKSPEVRVAHILVEVKEGAKPEEREAVHKRALEILDDVKKSKRPFEELVKLYSDDLPSKENGGDIGFQSRITLAPAIYDDVLKMKVGEVRGLIESPFGYRIVKVIDRRAYDLSDKRQIRTAIFEDKRAKIFNDYFERTKKQYPISINRDALKSVTK